LTVIDAFAFPGNELRYIFPAALLLTIAAVWLSVEGLRLLVHRNQSPPPAES
jgi:hypothetical protein